MTNNEIVSGFDDEKDGSLKIILQNKPDIPECLVLCLAGYLDTYNSNLFQQRIAKAMGAGYIKLIFQCAGLTYVSSTGIGAFSSILKSVKPRGGDMVLVEIKPPVYEVFELLGFAQVFMIKDTLDASFDFFRSSSGREPGFPTVLACPTCSKKLKISKPGRFRCSECKTILAVDTAGNVYLG
ncbi:MAG: STAS domain-containing protein [Treponema sp.]|jgi:anti-anti-sigma factor|nr:STAS domain-containing protein [Treponema sp.]